MKQFNFTQDKIVFEKDEIKVIEQYQSLSGEWIDIPENAIYEAKSNTEIIYRKNRWNFRYAAYYPIEQEVKEEEGSFEEQLDNLFTVHEITGYKCKLCGTTGNFDEFIHQVIHTEFGKESEVLCKNPKCDGENDDLEELFEKEEEKKGEELKYLITESEFELVIQANWPKWCLQHYPMNHTLLEQLKKNERLYPKPSQSLEAVQEGLSKTVGLLENIRSHADLDDSHNRWIDKVINEVDELLPVYNEETFSLQPSQEKIERGAELDEVVANWHGWLSARIPNLDNGANEFWIKQALKGISEDAVKQFRSEAINYFSRNNNEYWSEQIIEVLNKI